MTFPQPGAAQQELFAQDGVAPCEAIVPALPDLTTPAPRTATPVAPVPLFKAPPVPTRSLPVPPRGPNDPPLRQIQLGSHTVHYALRRSTRRSHGFMISDDGLRVTSPRLATLADIDRAIRAKQGWILAKLFERSERQAMRVRQQAVEWVDGARLPYLGADIVLRLEEAPRSHCRFDAQTRTLHVGVTPGLAAWQLRERVKLWFQDDARRLFGERLDLYAPQVGVRYSAYAISSAGTRWGSCTAAGNIRLNWKLIHYPLALLDYVVIHELAHLREMNHSPRFWAVVGEVFPDYDGAKAALRKRSVEMPLLFPD